MKEFKNLNVQVFPSREEMGQAAGNDVEKQIVALLEKKESIRMVFAAAPSQNEALASLVRSTKIDWQRITAFHMDEYIGLDSTDSRSFAGFLNEKIFQQVPFREVYLLNGNKPEETVTRYSKLLSEAPIDIVCLGIGENGHIAFNDPPVADFHDLKLVKRVTLDWACRNQQVNDGCFPTLDEVPTEAITLTIPALMRADYLFCVVPGKTKRQAVYNTLNGPITEECPASILRTHTHCKFYFDEDSFGSEQYN